MIAIEVRQQIFTFSDSITTRTFAVGPIHLEIVPPAGEETNWKLSVDQSQPGVFSREEFPLRKFDLLGTETEVRDAHDALVQYYRAIQVNDPDLCDLWDRTDFGTNPGWQQASLTYPKVV